MLTPFRLPTKTLIAPGSFDRLGDVASACGGSRALLITDHGLRATPSVDRGERSLAAAGFSVTVRDDVAPNPRADGIDRMAAEMRGAVPDLVIALGGGSVIDAAKAVAMLLRNPGSCRDYVGKNRFEHAAAPLIAVPTTCGTGSEVTWVSVISDEAARTKISVKGDGMFPYWAIVDSELLRTLPAHMVASTGMDAVTHAVEAYIGTASNPASDALAEQATVRLTRHLESAVGGNDTGLEHVMCGSTLAGMSFGNADVGAVHCLSEAIGGRHDLPHGLLNAMLLVPVLAFYGEAAADRLARMDVVTGGNGTSEAFVGRIDGLRREVGIPPFSSLNVPANDIDAIAQAAENNGSNDSNPRRMTAADYRVILESVL